MRRITRAACLNSDRFCYNVQVKPGCFWRVLVFPLLLIFTLGAALADQSVPEFMLKLQQDFASRQFESYLDAFAPDLREQQREELARYFDRLKMDSAALKWANKGNFNPAKPVVFLQVICQNSYSALVETWQLTLEDIGGRWQVKDKSARGNLSTLYKIQMPAERIERTESVEINHVDFKLVFRNALVFYDNIPNLETALLVVGEGRLVFSPSSARERHQLSLLYKNNVLEDRVEYAFLRFSDAFFSRMVKVSGAAPVSAQAVEEKIRRKAEAIYGQCRSHYFTVQSSLSQESLSFLPQRDEAVVQFRGDKTGEMAYLYSPNAEEEVTLYDTVRERFINLYSPESEQPGGRLVINFSPRYDVQDYEIELDFQPQSFYLSARAKLTLLSNVDGLDAVKFRLHPGLEILRIYDSERRELLFTQDPVGKILYIYFLEPVDRRVRTSIEVFYRGRLEPPAQMTDAVQKQWHSLEGVRHPDRFETFLFSQSAQWYPHPMSDDFFTARLKVIVPPAYSVISNGALVEKSVLNGVPRVTEIDKAGSTCSVYETKRPVKYLSFFVGKLNLMQEESVPLPLASYASSDVRSITKDLLAEAGRVLKFYESKFGPFPFENLRVVQRLWKTAGGHSPASFIILNDVPRIENPEPGFPERLVSSPGGPVDLSYRWKEYFLAHEIAHQWWGQGVSWARYQDQWLSEGLSQYASVLYLRFKYGDEAGAEILKRFSQWAEKKSRWGPITLGSRLSFTDYEAYQALVYDKSTIVLEMLRDLLGDEVFFTGLKEFFNEHRYGAAATGQFRQAMEKVSGRDLHGFFRLWFDSHLLPEAQVRYKVENTDAGAVLKVWVNQINESFLYPLGVAWEDGSGARRRETIVVEKKNEEFEFTLPGPPRKLEFNPDKGVPGKFRIQKD
jgi:Peptidase family M1 domain